MKLNDHDVVRATRQLSDNVPKGSEGTIVQVFESPRLAYLVEFSEDIETSELLDVDPQDVEPVFPEKKTPQ